MGVRGLLVVLGILCCACAWAIPRSASDSHINGFWLAQNQKGRETVALVTSKNQHVKCTFNYDTFPFSQTKDEKKEEEMPPSQILASYMRSNPCLSFKNDHGYHLCIGKNATQEVDGNRATPPLLLGVFKGWTSMGEQTYDEGSKDHCTISRTFTVQFTCDKTLKVVSVSEPSVCKYHFIVGAPEACGHRVFERQLSATGAGVETWYMEVFEARDEAISCVVHAAGFGLPSPTHSDTITDFSLKLEMGKTTLDIASFDARHGLRAPFEEADLLASDGGLKPLTLPLPASPNYLAITANTA